MEESSTIIEDSFFQRNQADPENFGIGGAIGIFGQSDVTVSRSSFYANASDSLGAISAFLDSSFLLIKDSTFTGNRSESDFFGSGSVLYLQGSSNTVSLLNVTITENFHNSGNFDEVGAVGLFLGNEPTDEPSNVLIRNSIISGNGSPAGGEGQEISVQGAGGSNSVTIDNSIIGDGSLRAQQGLLIDDPNTFLSLFDDTTSNVFGFSDAWNIPLRSIIGPRRFGITSTLSTLTAYHPLVLGSSAIDAGVDLVESEVFPGLSFVFPGCRGVSGIIPQDYRPDQLGRDRPQGRECDIGAVEFVDESFCWVIPLPSGSAVAPCL